ncbi:MULTISPECIES: ThiF family adenylyltransferase [unclassified Nitratiruptor]|uniref:HesA/MoeB/ThiF family protein n=1 Tax=unclassified Nitratiruptor TaxID=2624044 RepID=UPI0019169449|nr:MULTISPECIES: ThiF family adenylyltransferase [unclassified Nitratiruptor]BCD60585.1 molybdopterin-synthase adenylyltransferase [Nitratiruptor sp. YY08-10]BCD64516.1 molybdopterin-synthase adenylyltransferase [Nitratiruptor sp. YY08-14]
MMDYFARQVKLWGEERQKLLQKKSVAIIGCGGLGSSLALALGATGIGKIYLVDFDHVSVHNIHRQITFKVQDEGKNKAEVNACVIEDRCPYVEVESFVESFDEFAKRDIQVDLILDATDNLPVRAKIDEYAKATHTPWVYASVEEFHGQVCFMDKTSFTTFTITDRKPGGIAAPIVMHVASLEANLALRYLAELPVKKDLLYYLFFDEEGEYHVQHFKMPTEGS